MNSKIGGIIPVTSTLVSENRHQGKPNGSTSEPREKSEVSPDDSVVLTNTARKLLDAGMSVSSSGPVIDRARIEEIKSAIADGSFRPDAEKIASRLIELEIGLSE